MDEVSLLIDLVSSNWSSSATTLRSAGTISADHVATPNFVDVRTLQKNKGVRYGQFMMKGQEQMPILAGIG